jgi:hypothetical protein
MNVKGKWRNVEVEVEVEEEGKDRRRESAPEVGERDLDALRPVDSLLPICTI